MAETDDLKLRISRLERAVGLLATKLSSSSPQKQTSLAGVREYVRQFTTMNHGELNGLLDDDHTQYLTTDRHTALTGDHVTNGDSHDHSGGDGGQISYNSLSGLPSGELYIQSTAPVVTVGTAYLWVDTTGGDLNFWVEDGV